MDRIFLRSFNSVTQSFNLMIAYFFLNSPVPTTAPKVSFTFIVYIQIRFFEYTFCCFIFGGLTTTLICLPLENIQFLDQKYLVYSTKLVCSLVFLHSLYHLHTQNVLVLSVVVIFNCERDPSAYISIAVGSSCVVHSANVISSPPDMKSLVS